MSLNKNKEVVQAWYNMAGSFASKADAIRGTIKEHK